MGKDHRNNNIGDSPDVIPVEARNVTDVTSKPVPKTAEEKNKTMQPADNGPTNWPDKPIPADVDRDAITTIILRSTSGEERPIVVRDHHTVGGIRTSLDEPDDSIAVYESNGRTQTLNDDDYVVDYLDENDTLAFKPNARFG